MATASKRRTVTKKAEKTASTRKRKTSSSSKAQPNYVVGMVCIIFVLAVIFLTVTILQYA